MYKQLRLLIGRRRHCPVYYRIPSSSRKLQDRSYSVRGKKSEPMKEWTPSTSRDIKQPSELSILAKNMLLQSEPNTDLHSSTDQVTVNKIDDTQAIKELKLRLNELETSLKTIMKSDGGLYNKATIDSDIAVDWSLPDTNDDSIESITFADDIKVSLKMKPTLLLGSEDPNIPPSKIPCVGCGAPLQCQHNTFPGFMPSEYFKVITEKEMKTSLCQRCHYIQHCDAFKEVSTKPEEFAEMISQIKPTKSVIVMVVDVMDISGSIVQNLMEYVGMKHPLVIVGNKADLLAPDDPGFLKNVREELEQACYAAGLINIRKCTLVSAKTGFGIEKLISILFSFYKQRVDVFIVGTANAGKSSLFNALLASDYCKHTARDLIQRATISVWPGTTLNLLKFPIMRPSSRTVALRLIRLKQEKAIRREQRKIIESRKREKDLTWELKEEIKVTDVRTDCQRTTDETGSAWGQQVFGYKGRSDGTVQAVSNCPEPTPFEPSDLSNSYWTYDTPGLINPNQVMNLLTREEAPFLTPASMIVPQCLILAPGETVFVSGLARLDYLQGNDQMILVVHRGPKLPIHVVPSTEADKFYEENIGTEKMGIPLGGQERIEKLPSLIGKELTVVGDPGQHAAADIQLSSIGWVSLAPKKEQEVKVRVFTPGQKGIYLRVPALFPQYTKYMGKRKTNTPYYNVRPNGWVMTKANVDLVEDN